MNIFKGLIIYIRQYGRNVIVYFEDPHWDGYRIGFMDKVYLVMYHDDVLYKAEYLDNAVSCIEDIIEGEPND